MQKIKKTKKYLISDHVTNLRSFSLHFNVMMLMLPLKPLLTLSTTTAADFIDVQCDVTVSVSQSVSHSLIYSFFHALSLVLLHGVIFNGC